LYSSPVSPSSLHPAVQLAECLAGVLGGTGVAEGGGQSILGGQPGPKFRVSLERGRLGDKPRDAWMEHLRLDGGGGSP